MVVTPVPPMPVKTMFFDAVERRNVGQRRRVHGEGRDRLGLSVVSALDGDEGRAEAVDAGIVLITGRLVDLALAAELGVERLDRDAVRRLGTVAAALANQGVDENALGRRRHGSALAAAAFLVGADLIVNQHRDARNLAQLLLDGDQLGARADGHAFSEVPNILVTCMIVGDDHGLGDALGGKLTGDLRRGETALRRLAAGHGDSVIEQQLVSDVLAHRDGAAHRERPGMVVGAVAQIYEDVLLRGERRSAGPGQPLPAHLAGEIGVRVGEGRHIVAADAGQGAGAFRKSGRRIVRAAGAEERLADLISAQRHGGHARGGNAVEVFVNPLHVRSRRQAVGDGQRHLGHRQRAQFGEQRMALLVHLADDLGLGVGRQIVERGAGLGLQQRALVLDHH